MSGHARRLGMMGAMRLLLVLLSAILLASLVVATLTTKAEAAVDRRAVSPGAEPNFNSGLLAWYQDARGLRVAPCLDEAACALELPTPGQPVSATNFPDEVPYWVGETSMDVGETGAGGSASLSMSVVGAVIDPTTGDPAAPGTGTAVTEAGTVMTFNLRAAGLQPSTVYRITYPYGAFGARTDANGEISRRLLDTAGCEIEAAGQTCNFNAALQSPVFGGFLYWDSRVGLEPGFLGDPGVPHRVLGSPNGTNFFRIEGPEAGGVGVNRAQTNLFNITGQVLNPRPTFLSLSASPARVQAGRAAVLSGRLNSILGQRLSGKRVVIMQRPTGALRFTPVPGGARTTAADGSFRLRVTPGKTTTYRAQFAGEANAFWPSASNPAVVRVIR